MKILLATGSRTLATKLKKLLAPQFVIDSCASSDDILFQADQIEYKVFLIHVISSASSSVRAVEVVRKKYPAIPIIVLARLNHLPFRVEMLDLGIDLVVAEDCDSDELKARVLSMSRRSRVSSGSRLLQVRDLQVDLDTQQASRGNVVLPLRRKELELLVYLMEHAGQVVSRNMISASIWPDGSASQMAITVHMKYLRDRLDKPFRGKPYLKTIYGLGYRLS